MNLASTPYHDTHPPQRAEVHAVALEKVVFCWPSQEKATLEIPSLTVRAGEHVFIAGPSGSGKSTLLSLIAGILSPSQGSVMVNGTTMNFLSSAQKDIYRGDYIGFIFQQFNLIPYLSILDNVLIPCRFSYTRHKRSQHQGKTPKIAAQQLLERLDLSPDLWGRPVTRLSVGQQQRVAAARALIGRPSLLIADEPTSALDAQRRMAFLHLLMKECSEAGSTLLFVSHDKTLAHEFPRTLDITQLNKVAGVQACQDG